MLILGNKSLFKKNAIKLEEFEKELRVNEASVTKRLPFKEDIRSREVSRNEYIYKIFIKITVRC